MPLAGAVGVFFGVLGDGDGWWEGRSYLTNLFSSLTGLFFGVPFALLVLSRLTAAQADVVERRGVRRLIERVTGEFDSMRDAVFESARLRSHDQRADLVREWRDALREAKQSLDVALERWETETREAGVPAWSPGPQFQASASTQAALEAAADAVNGARSLRPYARPDASDWPEWEGNRKMLEARWMELNREVRERAKEIGLDWVSFGTQRVLDDDIPDHSRWRFCWKQEEEVAPTYRSLREVNVEGETRSAAMVWELLTVSEQIRRVTGTG
jgi:hypothetical protein